MEFLGALLTLSVVALILIGLLWFVARMLRQPQGAPHHTASPQPPAPDAIRPELAAALSDLEEALDELDTLTDESLDFETDIVGESFDGRQGTLWAIAERVPNGDVTRGIRFMARLVPEPSNAYDANAVAVVDHDSGKMLGYLGRHLAKEYQASVMAHAASGASLAVPAVVRGDRQLGVWLDLTRFNESAGLDTPEALLDRSDTYLDRRHDSRLVDGVAWNTHHALAREAASLGQHDVAAESYAKAVRGWLSAVAFDGQPPGAPALFEDYARWCRRAKRPDLELEVLQRYESDVAHLDRGASRAERLAKRLAAIRGEAASEAPF